METFYQDTDTLLILRCQITVVPNSFSTNKLLSKVSEELEIKQTNWRIT